MMAVRLGIDIGGTFTDITVLEEESGRVTVTKVPSRRGDPGGALISAVKCGLELAKVAPADVSMLVHGTTIVTNAVLERKLPPTALLTTEGFRDVLEIGRHFRPDMYDLQQDKAEALVPRERRLCVTERISADGEVLLEPDQDAIADPGKWSRGRRGVFSQLVCQSSQRSVGARLAAPGYPRHPRRGIARRMPRNP